MHWDCTSLSTVFVLYPSRKKSIQYTSLIPTLLANWLEQGVWKWKERIFLIFQSKPSLPSPWWQQYLMSVIVVFLIVQQGQRSTNTSSHKIRIYAVEARVFSKWCHFQAGIWISKSPHKPCSDKWCCTVVYCLSNSVCHTLNLTL